MKKNQDLRERCSYLLILFKAKDKALFEKYSADLTKISAEESTEFYHYLLGEYKKLVEGVPAVQPQKPVVKKMAKKVTKKVTKKAPAKKVAAKKKSKR